MTILTLSILSGILYRLGGIGKPYPFWLREVGVMTCVALALLNIGSVNWWIIATMGLVYLAQTTYFGFINPLFGKDKKDKYWWNWILVGIAFSLAVLPSVIVHSLWIGGLARLVVVTVFTAIWSEMIGEDWLEEFGRGAIQVATMPLLLL